MVPNRNLRLAFLGSGETDRNCGGEVDVLENKKNGKSSRLYCHIYFSSLNTILIYTVVTTQILIFLMFII